MAPLPKINKKEDIETLKRLYIDKRLSTIEIANISLEKFGQKISDSGIYSALLRNNIPIRSIGDSVSIAMSTLDPSTTFLTEDMIEWIDGFNLGDGYISFDKKRRDCRGAVFSFGSTNKEWTEYAMSKLKCYSPREIHKIENLDKKHPRATWASSTLTHPDIVKQAKRWYPNGKKIVPSDVRITPTSLLLWYLGDGSISKINISFFIRLATCGFAAEDIKNILIPKLSSLGLDTSHQISKNDIRISSHSLKNFFDIIGHKSPIKCYNYKFEYGDWLNLYRLSDIVKNNRDKWRIQYLFKQGKLDCSTSPGNKLIMFTEEQKTKVINILSNHSLHDEYNNESIPEKSKKNEIKVLDIIKNDTERWNARYLITRKIINSNHGILDNDQAELLRSKLNDYGYKSAIPSYMIENEFRKYRQEGFPFYNFSIDELKGKMKRLEGFSPIEEDGLFKWDGYGTELANYFHPHMFECNKKGKISAIDFFNSDNDFRRGISKLIALYPKITRSNIREICCNESVSSRINNFPPRVMLTILKKLYNGKKITMLDPCAGFSGRLLGSYASNIVEKYIGIDLSEKTYKGLIDTRTFINSLDSKRKFEPILINGNCIEIVPTIKDEIDFIFTSPPFLDEEQYSGVAVENNYENWKKIFIRPFIENAYKVLKNEGKLSVYTESIRRNDFPFDFCKISEEVGFNRLEDIKFKVPCRENLRSNSKFRIVNAIVFQKL